MKNSAVMIVNNDLKGWSKIISFKESLKSTSNFHIRLRGRGKNRKARCEAAGVNYNYCHDLPVKLADKIAVYIY